MIGRGPDDAGDDKPWQTGRWKEKNYLIRIACIKFNPDDRTGTLTSWQLADGEFIYARFECEPHRWQMFSYPF